MAAWAADDRPPDLAAAADPRKTDARGLLPAAISHHGKSATWAFRPGAWAVRPAAERAAALSHGPAAPLGTRAASAARPACCRTGPGVSSPAGAETRAEAREPERAELRAEFQAAELARRMLSPSAFRLARRARAARNVPAGRWQAPAGRRRSPTSCLLSRRPRRPRRPRRLPAVPAP